MEFEYQVVQEAWGAGEIVLKTPVFCLSFFM